MNGVFTQSAVRDDIKVKKSMTRYANGLLSG
jgi:hypothetical protein